MLDGLLGRGFAAKCKSLIKQIKTRIDAIRRKKKATQKFLKKDMADLLTNGLDINAYGRAEGLLAELTLSTCHDFVEHCCDSVLKHLSVMQKQRECPVECKAVVSSLMFAAARFSDLPELRDLRQIFQQRYENSVDYFVDQNFVENLSSKPITLEKKVLLMEEIAQEFSIRWDSRDFEKRMSKPSPSTQAPLKSYRSFHNDGASSGVGHELTGDGHKVRNGKEGNVLNKIELNLEDRKYVKGSACKSPNVGEETFPKKEIHDISFRGRQEISVDKKVKRNELDLQSSREVIASKYNPLNGKEETVPRGREVVSADKHAIWDRKEDATMKSTRLGSSSHSKIREYDDEGTKLHSREDTLRNSVSRKNREIATNFATLQLKTDLKETSVAVGKHRSQHDIVHPFMNPPEDKMGTLKPYYNNALPPPYVKPNVRLKDSNHVANLGYAQTGIDSYGVSKNPLVHGRVCTGSSSKHSQIGSDHTVPESPLDQEVACDSLPRPRSMRRRRSKSRSYHGDANNLDDTILTRKPRSRRRDDSRQGLHILFDDEHRQKDEEEKMIDKLLMHYSKKPTSFDPEKVKRKSRGRHAQNKGIDAGQSPVNTSRDGSDEDEYVPTPARSISLPHEQTAPPGAKVFLRAASFQPDGSNAARHVHPKLPDYDDLAARFASMRGR